MVRPCILFVSLCLFANFGHALTIEKVDPSLIIADGTNHELNVYGSDFGKDTVLSVDDENAVFEFIDSGHLICTVAYNEPGHHRIELRDAVTGDIAYWPAGIVAVQSEFAPSDLRGFVQPLNPAAGVPYIDSVNPFIIPADGQVRRITILGGGFSITGQPTQVFVDGNLVTTTYVDANTLSIDVGFSTTANHSIEVMATGDTVSGGWEPGLLSINTNNFIPFPSSASNQGGDVIYLYGLTNRFDPGVQVYFDSAGGSCGNLVESQKVTWLSDQELRVITPLVSTGFSGSTSIFVDNTSAPDFCQSGFSFSSPAAPDRDSDYVPTGSVLPPTSMTTNQTFVVKVKMKNTGMETWTKMQQHKLGVRTFPGSGPGTWGPTRVLLSSTDQIRGVPFYDIKLFLWTITAPPDPGTYKFQVQMIKEGVEWFGDKVPATPLVINVTASGIVECAPPLNDSNHTPEIQACLDQVPTNGGTVYLKGGTSYTYNIGNPGLVLKKKSTVFVSSNAPCSETTCAKLKATQTLTNPILISGSNPVPISYTIKYLVFDGNKANRFNGQGVFNCGSSNDGGSNIRIGGTGASVQNIWSKDTLCASALSMGVHSYFEFSNNVIKNSGEEHYPPKGNGGNNDLNPWADGMTLNECDKTASGSRWKVTGNTVSDSTDLDIVSGGGIGCRVEENTISHNTRLGFGGLAVHNFPANGAGNHTGSAYTDNTITSAISKLDLGISIGYHSWDIDLTARKGSISDNKSTSAVVNLSIDGSCNQTVQNNTFITNQGNFGWRFDHSSCNFTHQATGSDYSGLNYNLGNSHPLQNKYLHEGGEGGGSCGTGNPNPPVCN